MVPIHYLFQFILVSLLSSFSWAQTSERTRLSGFEEFKKEEGQFDTARAKGEKAHLEEEEQWINQRNRNLNEYKKEKKQAEISDDGPEAKADAAEKKKYAEVHEKNRKDYVIEKSKEEKISREDLKLPSESQELGLNETRPRYDYKKRVLYGARQKFGKTPAETASSSSPGRPGSVPGSGPTPNFPPPPTFDDFGDNGYVPAPMPPDDFGDMPPPPPPPPPPPFGGDDFGGGDSFPPPPPPPPPFDGDF
ncbi:MAG: hypothetical protein ACXVCP_10620 [Bdellovibrio sp.]